MNEALKEYCVRCDRRELLDQWHPGKNGDMTPDKITSGSQKKIWWCCDQGHEWESVAYERAKRGTGCPYCAGKRILPGMDLAARYPYLADQWHPRRNGELRPEEVLPGSQRSAWWKCSRGHEWRATINSRVNGRGCPICAGRAVLPGENDLETAVPALAAQWHPEKNGPLRPSQVISGSNRKVWWCCEHGHEWQATVKSRVQGSGCPVCAGMGPDPLQPGGVCVPCGGCEESDGCGAAGVRRRSERGRLLPRGVQQLLDHMGRENAALRYDALAGGLSAEGRL